jgi:hypothetical protein
MKFRERLLFALTILLSDPNKKGLFAGACARCRKAFYVDAANNVTNAEDHSECMKEAEALALYDGLKLRLQTKREGSRV